MNVSIRLAKKGDAKAIIELWNEGFERGHLTYTGTQRRGNEDIKRFDKRYAERKKNLFTYVAIGDETGKPVGVCSFDAKEYGRTRHRGGLGWMIHPDYSRKGIGTRLLRVTLKEARNRGFKKAEAEAAVDNVASVRLDKKLGFKIEDRKKAGLLLDNGKYVDTYVFGKILR